MNKTKRTMHTLCERVNGAEFEKVKYTTEQLFGKRRNMVAYSQGKNSFNQTIYCLKFNMTDAEYIQLCEEFYK